MNERIFSDHERHGHHATSTNLFDEAPDCQLPVTVSSGPYAEQLPVGNLTVGQIRQRFRDRFDLDPNSQAVVDGNDVNEDFVVRPGQALMFTRRAGEKGQAQ